MTDPRLLPAGRITLPRLVPGRMVLGRLVLLGLIHGAITDCVLAQQTPAQEPQVTISFKVSSPDAQPLIPTATPGQGPTVNLGDRIMVEILLSLNASSAPLADVRLVQFDLRGTSESLVVETFRWLLDARAYGFQRTELPGPSAASLLMGSNDRLLRLTDKPMSVARLELTVNGDGTLDVGAFDPGRARVRCGFDSKSVFAASENNMAGGRLRLSASTESASANAQDKTQDTAPDKPGDHTDQGTNPDTHNQPSGETGTNHAKAKRSGKRCGNGSVGAMLFLALALMGLRFRFSTAGGR